MFNNYPTSNSYMIHLAEEMKSIYEGVSDNETKIFALDDIYVNKINAWLTIWTDEELAYLNAVYDRYMKELLA